MVRLKSAAMLFGASLLLAPLVPAHADWSHKGGHWGPGGGAPAYHGGWGHGYSGGHGYYGYGAWPIFAVGAAVVGVAAAIVTAPFVLLNAAVNAPYYGPTPGYAPPPASYQGYAPPRPSYHPGYAPPPASYNTPGPGAYGAPSASYSTVPPDYVGPAAGTYYAPPARTYAPRPPSGYYAGGYNGAPANYAQAYSAPRPQTQYQTSAYYGSPSSAPRYSYDYGR